VRYSSDEKPQKILGVTRFFVLLPVFSLIWGHAMQPGLLKRKDTLSAADRMYANEQNRLVIGREPNLSRNAAI